MTEVIAFMFLRLSEYGTISQWEPLISLAGGRTRRAQNEMNYSQYLLWYKLISLGGEIWDPRSMPARFRLAERKEGMKKQRLRAPLSRNNIV